MKVKRTIGGIHAVESALTHFPERILTAWVDAKRSDSRAEEVAAKLRFLGVPIHSLDRARMGELAEGVVHQGVMVEIMPAPELGDQDLQAALDGSIRHPFFLVLDHVQDPHNLGACLRSADAAGVHGVIVTKDQSVGLTPVVAKVACGAAETVPLYRVTNLVRALDWLKKAGLWIVGAAGEAKQVVYEVDLNMPIALVMGAEGKGLRRLTRENCDFLVKIPMQGSVGSLNVSVATGVLLFEALRQRSALSSR